METPDPKIIAAVIASITSIILAIISLIQTIRYGNKMEKLKHELSKKKTQYDARLDYEYEARKKLYSEYEPLFFQYVEFADIANAHIKAMAYPPFKGLDNPEYWNKKQWMSRNSYYFLETVYKVFSPLAMFNILSEKINSYDVGIEEKIHTVYKLGKILYYSFQHDFRIAGHMAKEILIKEDENFKRFGIERDKKQPKEKQIPFKDAYLEEWQKNVTGKPEDFDNGEGIRTGKLDKIIAAFIINNGENKRVITFGEFERKINESSNDWLDIIEYRFKDFDPTVNKVLWRILVVQACIYDLMMGMKSTNENFERFVIDRVKKFFKEPEDQKDDDTKPAFKGNITDALDKQDVIDSTRKYVFSQLGYRKIITQDRHPQ